MAVNGTIRPVTRTIPIDGLRPYWTALVPEDSFRSGANEIRLFYPTFDEGGWTLHPIPNDLK